MSKGKKDSVVPAVVLELIDESETIQGWMDRLPDHADESYPEVIERVTNDYQGRLDGVAEQLAEHAPDLVSSLGVRRGNVKSMQSDRGAHVDDLEEARLRHFVGEFSDEEWESRRTTIEGLLSKVDGLLKIEESAVAEFEEALEKIDVGGPADAAVVFGSDGPVEVRTAAAGHGSWSIARSVHVDRPATNGSPGVPAASKEAAASDSDELDFLDAVSPETLERLDSIAIASRNGS